MIFQQLFESGISLDALISKNQDANIEKLLGLYHEIELEDELVNKIKSVNKRIYILGFAEMWCPDCIINLPAIKKLQEINPNIICKILPREGNEAHMEKYKISGKPKIPTFIILDDQFKELGAFIENPKVVKNIVNKGNQVEIIVAKRKYNKGEYVQDTIKEIVDIITRS